MKRFVATVFTVIMLLVSVLSVNVSAAAELAIANAHFDAVINADGTVSVTETWNVEYSGTGDGFTRWIDLYDSKNQNEMTALEKFDTVTDIAVKINGEAIPEAKSGANTYRYGESSDGRSLNIVINSPSAQETKEYTVSYTLNGAVKKNGNNAEFAYVFIGKTFEYVGNNISATVYFPEGIESDDILFDEESSALLSGNTVEYSPGRVYDTFRIDVKCDTDVFEAEALVKYSAFKEGFKKVLNVILDILYWLFIAAVVIVVIILALFSDKLRRLSIEKKAGKKPADEKAEITALDSQLSACAAYKMLVPYSRIAPKSTTKKVTALFAMAILECAEKGYIVNSSSGLVVGTPSGDAPEYILSVLNFLKTFSEKSGNRYVIDAEFADRVKSECMSSYDVITNYLGTFYNLIPSSDGKFFKDEKNKEMYENAYILKSRIHSEKIKTTFSDCMRKVLAGEKTSSKDIFALLFTSGSANKIFADSSNDGVAALSRSLAAMSDVLIKSK